MVTWNPALPKIKSQVLKTRLPTWKTCPNCKNMIMYAIAYFKVIDEDRHTKRTVVGKYCENCKTIFYNGAVRKFERLAK